MEEKKMSSINKIDASGASKEPAVNSMEVKTELSDDMLDNVSGGWFVDDIMRDCCAEAAKKADEAVKNFNNKANEAVKNFNNNVENKIDDIVGKIFNG